MFELFHILLIIIVFLSTGGYILHLITQKKSIERTSNLILIASVLFQGILILTKWIYFNRPPIVGFSEAFFFLSWCLGIAFLSIQLKYKIKSFGAFITPIILILLIISFIQSGEEREFPSILKSTWLPIHATISLLSYAFYTLSFCLACIFVIQDWQIKSKCLGGIFKRLPSLALTDTILDRCLKIAFSLLTLSIITGSIWAEAAFGNFWSWDPKETWSLIMWLFTAAMIHQRLTVGWRGKRFAIMTIIVYLILLIAYFGVKFLTESYHNYG